MICLRLHLNVFELIKNVKRECLFTVKLTHPITEDVSLYYANTIRDEMLIFTCLFPFPRFLFSNGYKSTHHLTHHICSDIVLYNETKTTAILKTAATMASTI